MVEADSPASASKSLLVVAGSGRSGTSLFAGLAGRLGFYIPQPELKPNETNPRGFGEPRWALAFHKQLLNSVDVTHDDGRPQAWTATARVANREAAQATLRSWLAEQFDQSDRVVIKDPRLAWFIDLYARVSEDLSVDLRIATMLRHPVETVRSKQLAYGGRSDGMTRMAAWANMMLNVEHKTRNLPRAVIRYDDLLAQWRATLIEAERPLAIGLVTGATDAQIADAEALVDPTLRRSPADWAELSLPGPLRELAEETYAALSAFAVKPDAAAAEPAPGRLDDLRDAYTSYFSDAEAVVKSSLIAARAAERRRIQRHNKSKSQKAKRAHPDTSREPQVLVTSQPAPAPGARDVLNRVGAGIRRRAGAIARRSRA